jgi:hypothetical protein
LYIGVTCASFSLSGKEQVSIDKLIIEVIGFTIADLQHFISLTEILSTNSSKTSLINFYVHSGKDMAVKQLYSNF